MGEISCHAKRHSFYFNRPRSAKVRHGKEILLLLLLHIRHTDLGEAWRCWLSSRPVDISDITVNLVGSLHHDGVERRTSVRSVSILGLSGKCPDIYFSFLFSPYFFTLFCLVDEKDILLRVFLTLRDILPFTVQMRTQNHHFEPDTLMFHFLR